MIREVATGLPPEPAVRGDPFALEAARSERGETQGAENGRAAVVSVSQQGRMLARGEQPDETARESQRPGAQEEPAEEGTPSVLKPYGAQESEEQDDSLRVGDSVAPDDPYELSEAEAQEVEELEARDREVRTHEQAHKAAGGQYAGAIHLEYETGPDGKRYAVGGEVPIDVSPVRGDPEATIRKMDQVRRAALAPAQPSGADRAVAVQASQIALEARSELAAERQDDSGDRLGEQGRQVAAVGSRFVENAFALVERPPPHGDWVG